MIKSWDMWRFNPGENMTNITMREMLEAGVHFGHQTRFWNPKMTEYIFGTKRKIHIINLEKTLPLFQEAVNFLGSVAAKRGKILFVGTKYAARDVIREEAIRCGMPYISNRWLGGLLTNYKTVRQSIKHLKSLEAKRDSLDFAKIPKKEALVMMRELSKLDSTLSGIKDMGGIPDAIFVVDVGHEKIAVDEANKLRIPVVGIVDTNRNPKGIDYLVPANDDSTSAIRLYAKCIADAIIDARSNLPMEEIIAEKESRRGTPSNKRPSSKPKKRVEVHKQDTPKAKSVKITTNDKETKEEEKKKVKTEEVKTEE